MSKGIICKYVNVIIEKSLVTKPVVTVMGHEIPFLKKKWGESKISLAPYGTKQTREIDDLQSEYFRLRNRYGSAKDSETPIVAGFFGDIEAGMWEEPLAKLMEKDPLLHFKDAPVSSQEKVAPATNNIDSAKVTKANLNKGALLTWFKDTQEIIEDEDGSPLKSMKASDLNVWAKIKLHELIEEMGGDKPHDDEGTTSLTRTVISLQEEG